MGTQERLAKVWSDYKKELGRDYLPDVPAAIEHGCRGQVESDVYMGVLEQLAEIDPRDMPLGDKEFVYEFLYEMRQIEGCKRRLIALVGRHLVATVTAELESHRFESGITAEIVAEVEAEDEIERARRLIE